MRNSCSGVVIQYVDICLVGCVWMILYTIIQLRSTWLQRRQQQAIHRCIASCRSAIVPMYSPRNIIFYVNAQICIAAAICTVRRRQAVALQLHSNNFRKHREHRLRDWMCSATDLAFYVTASLSRVRYNTVRKTGAEEPYCMQDVVDRGPHPCSLHQNLQRTNTGTATIFIGQQAQLPFSVSFRLSLLPQIPFSLPSPSSSLKTRSLTPLPSPTFPSLSSILSLPLPFP